MGALEHDGRTAVEATTRGHKLPRRTFMVSAQGSMALSQEVIMFWSSRTSSQRLWYGRASGFTHFCLVLAALCGQAGMSVLVAEQSSQTPRASASTAVMLERGSPPPADYVIGPDDVLMIVFWQEKDLSTEVVVRPDGNISLPLLNDLKAAGITPEQLRLRLVEEARNYIEEPDAAVVVKQVNSRKVFIMGQVQKPGVYPLTAPTTVVQLIATAGGLVEFASIKNILVMRNENGRQIPYRVNYKEILSLKNLSQNIELKPGDTVIVP
jgi:polysaccharide export outer membrane protein